MSQRDRYHTAVRNALIADGWTITHDPYSLSYGATSVFVDIGAEAPLAAERGTRRIAVEVKSFVGISRMVELERALGQYVLYRSRLQRIEPQREMYLGVPSVVFEPLFNVAAGRDIIADIDLRYFLYDPDQELITQWNP